MIPGTGLSNVADSARLSRACLDMGCAAVMTLPPFYYKNVSEAGLYQHFVQLIRAIGDDAREGAAQPPGRVLPPDLKR